jgi:hypothetical protein
MICQGLVSNWGGLMTTRFFLGLFEAGMFPGCKFARFAKQHKGEMANIYYRLLLARNVVYPN